jgi:hypothetical protein
MRRLFALGIALSLLPQLAFAKKPHCTFRLHVAANARDSDTFATQWTSQNGQKVVIEKMPTISERDVIAFKAYKAPDQSFGALLQLDDHGRLSLDALSVEHRGGSAFLFMNGRPLTEMQIDRRVSDGKIYIASGLTVQDIAAMKKDWALIGAKRR